VQQLHYNHYIVVKTFLDEECIPPVPKCFPDGGKIFSAKNLINVIGSELSLVEKNVR
jgi:hypothetical protein